jgi:hypothetical protein
MGSVRWSTSSPTGMPAPRAAGRRRRCLAGKGLTETGAKGHFNP